MTDRPLDPNKTHQSEKGEKGFDENERYFKVDDGYDKRLYENDLKNIIFIIFLFIIYYAINIVIFLGQIALGTTKAKAWQWHAIALFIFTIIFILLMLVSGKKANDKKAKYEYYMERIREERQRLEDEKKK